MEARAVELPASFAILDDLLASAHGPGGAGGDGVARLH